MATNYTTNYDLCQWEPTDAVQRVEFNADNAKIDAALKSLSDQVVQKANQSALNTLVTAVNQKADQTDLTAAVGRISALESGKADQTSLDQVEADLRAENGLVRLSQVTMDSSASSCSLTVPDWDDAWELQLRYNLVGEGEIRLFLNNGVSCYNMQSGEAESSIQLKSNNRTCCAGTICLHGCGSAGWLSCRVIGASIDDNISYSSSIQRAHVIHSLSPATLTSVQFKATTGTFRAVRPFAFFKIW